MQRRLPGFCQEVCGRTKNPTEDEETDKTNDLRIPAAANPLQPEIAGEGDGGDGSDDIAYDTGVLRAADPGKAAGDQRKPEDSPTPSAQDRNQPAEHEAAGKTGQQQGEPDIRTLDSHGRDDPNGQCGENPL